MCAFDELSISQSSAQPILIHYEVQVTKHEERIVSTSSTNDASITNSSTESLGGPPAYEAPAVPFAMAMPHGKRKILRRIFCRSSKKHSAGAELPSYREAELIEAWAKVGIDINDRSQGPRPKCTPEELLGAMDGLFGAPTMPKSAPAVGGQRKLEDAVVVHSFPGSRLI